VEVCVDHAIAYETSLSSVKIAKRGGRHTFSSNEKPARHSIGNKIRLRVPQNMSGAFNGGKGLNKKKRKSNALK